MVFSLWAPFKDSKKHKSVALHESTAVGPSVLSVQRTWLAAQELPVRVPRPMGGAREHGTRFFCCFFSFSRHCLGSSSERFNVNW